MGIIYNFVRHAFLLEMWLEKPLMREQLNRRPNFFMTSGDMSEECFCCEPVHRLTLGIRVSEV